MPIKRLVSTTLLSLTLIASVAAPAVSAGSRSLFKSSGVSASTYWTQVDATEQGSSPFGNVHFGNLYAMESGQNLAYASIYIDDYDCPKGTLPDWSESDPCVWKGSRFGYGEGLSFTVSRKLTTARLQGSVELFGGDDPQGGVVGRPAVDVTWTGVGSLGKFSSTYRWSDGNGSYSGRYSGQSRQATMSGTIGTMGFDPARSGGSIDSYREMSKSTSN